MRKITNGRKYDTETAKKICDTTVLYNGNNVSGWETLYKKKTGEFFIHFCATGWDCFNSVSYIKPITEEEAKEFVEENSDVETYEKLFGEVEE